MSDNGALDREVECVVEVLLERSKDHRKPTIEKLAVDLITRLTTSLAAAEAGRVEAERERDGYKDLSFENAVRSSGWMRCHDQLMAWIQDRQAVLNELMDSDPRTAFPSPSDVPTLQAAESRAIAAEQKLATVRDVVTCAEAINLLATQRGQYYASVAGDTLYRDYMSAPNRALDEAIQRYHEAKKGV